MNIRKIFALVLVFALVFVNFGFSEEKLGLFDKLKIKASQKIQDIKSKEWWVVQGGGKAAGLIVGKSLGVLGMGLGVVLGSCVAGPVGAAAGSIIGFRIADTLGRTFAKPVGERIASNKFHDRPADVKGAIQSLDKKALAVEGGAAAVGSLIGEAIGITAGVALLAGVGPIAIPIMGVVTGAVLGKKLGKAFGGWLGNQAARKAAVAGYRALTAAPPGATPPTGVASASPGMTAPLNSLKDKYEAAYRAYVKAQASPGISQAQLNRLMDQYRTAFSAYKQAQILGK